MHGAAFVLGNMTMIALTAYSLRLIFPHAPQAVLDAFNAKQDVLTQAGINATENRLAFFLANIEHESGGFTIRGLTENVHYTAERMAIVWPNRFKGPQAVVAKYGTNYGWQAGAFDDIYGNRMGNRPGTHDGSTYIGRGGPQVTGRGGYEAVGQRCGLDLINHPEYACMLNLQPEVSAAFWTWKDLNHFADVNDFVGCVKVWNGGTNGLADRELLLAGNDPILRKLNVVQDIIPALQIGNATEEPTS